MQIEENKDQENIFGLRPESRSRPQKDTTPSSRMIEEITTSILNPNTLNLEHKNFFPNLNQIASTFNSNPVQNPSFQTQPITLNNLNTNHIMHGISYNSNNSNSSNPSSIPDKNSNNRSFNNPGSDNADKKSVGRCLSNNNSNNSSNMKHKVGSLPKSGNGSQKYSDHNTDSTYISGGDSPPALLDCDESLNNNFVHNNNAVQRAENYSWVEKFQLEYLCENCTVFCVCKSFPLKYTCEISYDLYTNAHLKHGVVRIWSLHSRPLWSEMYVFLKQQCAIGGLGMVRKTNKFTTIQETAMWRWG